MKRSKKLQHTAETIRPLQQHEVRILDERQLRAVVGGSVGQSHCATQCQTQAD